MAAGDREADERSRRRQTDIHLPRYRAEHPKEYAEFCRVAIALLEAVEFAGDADALLPSLYRGSIGAIGNLAGWLRAAAFRASRRGESFERALAATRKPDDALATLAREAIAGERAMEQSPQVRSELDELLRLSDLPAASAAPAARRGRRRPGIRNPTRDPVGTSHATS